MYSLESLKKFLLDKWWIFALVGIFLFAYWIRSVGNVPDRILSFDPSFFYRFTKYFADWGHFPVWDELSYYVGRGDTGTNSIIMWMVTGTIYNFFKGAASLFTVASTMAAIYGALIVIPAFLLGRELSNKYGGIFAAALIGTAPQILIRTFGASYDTDQLALLFMIFSLYAGFRCLRKKTIESLATSIIVFSAAMLSWGFSVFSFIILCGYAAMLFIMQIAGGGGEKSEKIKIAFNNFKGNILFLSIILIGVHIIGIMTKSYDAVAAVLGIVSFAQRPEVWIVNISIAELQPFNIFSLEGWMHAMGRFAVGDGFFDMLIFAAFLAFMLFGLVFSYKKDLKSATLMTTIFIIAFYVTTRGIRFTEFSSALFLVIIAAGFGYAMEYLKGREIILRSSIIGVSLLLVFFAFGISSQLAFNLGPDIDSDWDNTWQWIKNNTPEDSIIGTWWDPGHMIAGYAERRNFADGAHCPGTCKYTINDRIVDLGKIMATTDENVSVQLIQKYRGTSSKVYWIASDDLIPKYQWLQFFGMGCDSRTDSQKCPLYQAVRLQGSANTEDGNVMLRNYLLSGGQQNYQSIITFETNPRVAFYNQNGNIFLFSEVLAENNNNITSFRFDINSTQRINIALDQFYKQLKLTPSNATIDASAYFTKDFQYVYVIPKALRNNVLTKMFFLGGEGLEHFKPVFSNSKVKIYEVV